MIPIQPKPEPANFNINIRIPGMRFLTLIPYPSKSNWKGNELWRNCLRDLYNEYNGVCAYIGMWIPRHDATVDHFLSKSYHPQYAYDWNNYRLSCEKANNNKADHDILDPFDIQDDWFTLDFPSLLVESNQNILPVNRILVDNTIHILGLNSEYFIQDRLNWVMMYIQVLDLAHLERFAPFIAQELKRQKLETDIIEIMQVRTS